VRSRQCDHCMCYGYDIYGILAALYLNQVRLERDCIECGRYDPYVCLDWN
jgi:hypothetical protein